MLCNTAMVRKLCLGQIMSSNKAEGKMISPKSIYKTIHDKQTKEQKKLRNLNLFC